MAGYNLPDNVSANDPNAPWNQKEMPNQEKMRVYWIYVPTWTVFKVKAESPEEAKKILLQADEPMEYWFQFDDEPDWRAAKVEEDYYELAE
jgi:hypothetical protein